MTKTFCYNCGIKFNEPVCLSCNPNGKTPENRLAGVGLLLIFISLFAAPFLFDESELAMIRDAVVLPFLLFLGISVVVGAVMFGILFLCASLPARNVRLK